MSVSDVDYMAMGKFRSKYGKDYIAMGKFKSKYFRLCNSRKILSASCCPGTEKEGMILSEKKCWDEEEHVQQYISANINTFALST